MKPLYIFSALGFTEEAQKMTLKNCTYLFTALFMANTPALAVEPPRCSTTDCGDSSAAVSSLLLAAGMYGGLNNGVDLAFNESAKMFKGIFAEQGQIDGQDITLSYTGSEGRLGFSAGYLYTALENSPEIGAVLLNSDTYSRNTLHNEGDKPWYVTFNLFKEFQLSDNIAFGVDSRTMLISPSFLQKETGKESQAVCMSFNLPVSYGKFLTVTPELQWSRVLEIEEQAASVNNANALDNNPNTFYGGMSISLSY